MPNLLGSDKPIMPKKSTMANFIGLSINSQGKYFSTTAKQSWLSLSVFKSALSFNLTYIYSFEMLFVYIKLGECISL